MISVIYFTILIDPLHGQVKWDGGGGDGQWQTAANWVGDVLPKPTDNVVLDNTLVTNTYTISIPPGNNSISVKTLTISPADGKTIELRIPASSTAVPAFTATGPGYGLTINNGGIFRNASGASSGAPVAITDSIRINNGGRYIHNTSRSHATNVAVLSKAPGTESGIFEFDIPAASSTISLSDRVFGSLLLSSTAAGGTTNYTGSGTNPVLVRSDLQTAQGTSLSLNFSDTFLIKGNLFQNNGAINLGNSSRSLVMAIQGNIQQMQGGLITETGTGLQEILLNGSSNQGLQLQGTIANSVSLKINGAKGASLLSPVSLPFKLELTKGILFTSGTNLLTLQAACTVQADSLSSLGFVCGPMRKEGMSGAVPFLFPVGKDNNMRWLLIKNATGNFTVEYQKSNPQQLGSSCSGIDHISRLEYWSVSADGPLPKANLELSFNDPNSGGVTDLASLRTSRLGVGSWVDAGNIAVTGTAGSRGSVTSNFIDSFGSGTNYFTLASSASGSNPLPIALQPSRSVKQTDKATNESLSIKLFPTVARELITLLIKAGKSRSLHFIIVDLQGHIMEEVRILIQPGNNEFRVLINGFPAGWYHIFEVSSSSHFQYFPFLKF